MKREGEPECEDEPEVRVLELGAGVGYLGMSLAANAKLLLGDGAEDTRLDVTLTELEQAVGPLRTNADKNEARRAWDPQQARVRVQT